MACSIYCEYIFVAAGGMADFFYCIHVNGDVLRAVLMFHVLLFVLFQFAL